MTSQTTPSAHGIDGYVLAGDLRLHYLEYGTGPALVIVPGITSPAITWGMAAAPLSVDHRVLSLDTRGRGLSDKPKEGFRLRDYAGDLEAMIDQLGLERPILLGHSMGARIVATFVADHPDSASASILVDPPMSGPGRAPYPITRETFRNQIVQARDHGLAVADVQRQYPLWDEEACRLRAQWLSSCDELAVVESHRSFEEEDVIPYLRAVPPPALFVYGAASPVVTAENVREVSEANPRLELAEVPEAAHMIPWENLDGFLAVVRQFVTRIENGS